MEAIADFGRHMQAGPVAGVLVVGAVLGGCTARESDGIILQDEKIASTACWIESVRYDAAQEALQLDISVHGLRGVTRSLAYTATSIRSEQSTTGERVADGYEVFGSTDLIGTATDNTETHQAVVAFHFEADSRDQYRVLLDIHQNEVSTKPCGDQDFVLTKKDGELVVEPSDATTVCDRSRDRPILVKADQVDEVKYTSDPSKLLFNCTRPQIIE